MSADVREIVLGPWNPGLASDLPRELLPLSTLLRHANATTSVAAALELADFTGLPWEDLTELRPERLVLHELLIRITADLSVPDGQKYEHLGINFRAMTQTIMDKYIAPHMPEVTSAFADMRRDAAAQAAAELRRTLFRDRSAPPAAQEATARRGWLARLTRRPSAADPRPPSVAVEDDHQRFQGEWAAKAAAAEEPLAQALYGSLARIGAAIYHRHGRLIGSQSLFETLCLTLVCNGYGSALIGRLIAPYVAEAAVAEAYRVLPAQPKPVVINIKGASASGKSTMRPLQRELARTLGVAWQEFALVSPDIWRKYLLDYASLGAARRYAGTLTGHELAIIDRKLDRYMALKGESGRMTHLLIDRFRFDSFASEPGREDGSRLLTRFGNTVYLNFMITPPEATVERAWKRGEQFGRYKALDDILAHNVEAYTGMPRLFFLWARKPSMDVHYEFLDNSVAEGERPRTVAFGSNGYIAILDVHALVNVDRFAKINIAARSPAELYPAETAAGSEAHAHFLAQCAQKMRAVDFADFATGRIYARLEEGELVWSDPDVLDAAMANDAVRLAMRTVAPQLVDAGPGSGVTPRYLDHGSARTLGAWGGHAPSRP